MTSISEQICVLIVDDEAPARKRLSDLLSRDPEVGRILEAENGVAAVALIQDYSYAEVNNGNATKSSSS